MSDDRAEELKKNILSPSQWARILFMIIYGLVCWVLTAIGVGLALRRSGKAMGERQVPYGWRENSGLFSPPDQISCLRNRRETLAVFRSG